MTQTNLIGETILGYTVGEVIGSGTYGTVYKASKSNASGHYVRALKHIAIPTEKQYTSILNSMGGDVAGADDYFAAKLNSVVAEIKILNDLSEKGSNHIVRYYENDIRVTEAEGKRYDIFILMEYLTPLDVYIQQHDFTVDDVVELGLSILDALQVCHENSVIHRDIKDENIFVSNDGVYKIGDFGVSKVLKEGSRAESMKGTPNFLAPEIYLKQGNYTASVDLYSLGIVLYRLLNYSRNPFLPHYPARFNEDDEDAAFEARMRGDAPDFPSLGGEEIGNVVIKAIADRDERFQTADEFRQALKAAKETASSRSLAQSIKLETTNRSKFQSSKVVFEKTKGEVDEEDFSVNINQTARDKNRELNKYVFENDSEVSPKEPQSEMPTVTPESTTKPKVLNKTGAWIVGIAIGLILATVLGITLLFMDRNRKTEAKAASLKAASEAAASQAAEEERQRAASEAAAKSMEEALRKAESEAASLKAEQERLKAESEAAAEAEKEQQSQRSNYSSGQSRTSAPAAASTAPTETPQTTETTTTDVLDPGFTGEESMDELVEGAEDYAQTLLDSLQ